jgi:hypothetical protein
LTWKLKTLQNTLKNVQISSKKEEKKEMSSFIVMQDNQDVPLQFVHSFQFEFLTLVLLLNTRKPWKNLWQL